MTAEFSQERIAQIEAAAQTVLDLGDEKITVTPADFEITSEDMPGWLVASEGKLTVALDITLTLAVEVKAAARPEGGVVVDSDVDDEPIRIAVTRI